MNHIKKIFGINKSKYKDLGLPEELISIYKKSKTYRTFKDNLYLIQKNDHLNCFQNIIKTNKEGELIYETIIKNLDFVIYEPEKIIYYPKDMITNMFYIFHGSVKIDKNQYQNFLSPIKNKHRNKNENKNKKIKTTFSISIHEEESSEENSEHKFTYDINNIINIDNNKKKDIKELGFFKKLYNAMKKYNIYKENKKELDNDDDNNDIIILSKGDMYGENDFNLPRRMDLVETKTNCVIGFLSKHDWKYIFEKTDALKKNDMLTFLKNLKILKEVNNEVVINNIYNAIKEKRIYRGESLIKYGEKSNKFYIIRKGYFQVNLNFKQRIRNQFNDLNYFGHYTLKEKSKNIKYEIKNYYFNDEKYKIVTYGEGEIIGDIELYLGSQKFLTDIFCNTDSSLVYEINFKDFNINSNRTMKELLLKEGKQKLKYFRERIYNIKIINSKKMDSINRFKEIISNKLEEEKGEIFNQIENNESGRYKYEKKQRKRLKSASLNDNLKNIITEINNQQFENYKFINYKNLIEKGRNNYLFKYNKEYKEEYLIFPTSINNDKNNPNNNNNNNDNNNTNNLKKEKNTKYSNYIKTAFNKKNNIIINSNNKKKIQRNKKKTITFLLNNPINNFNRISNENKHFNNYSISPLKKKQSSKINTSYLLHFKNESLVKKRKMLSSKKFRPFTLNEKFQHIFTRLFINKKNREPSIEENDSLNNINYNNNTQESSAKKKYEFSKYNLNTCPYNSFKNEQKRNKIFWSPKIEDCIYKKENMPLLTEIIKNKKNILFKKLSSGNNRNYSVKESCL